MYILFLIDIHKRIGFTVVNYSFSHERKCSFCIKLNNLGDITPNRVIVVNSMQLIAIVLESFVFGGCFMVDLKSGMKIEQPKFLSILVVKNSNMKYQLN